MDQSGRRTTGRPYIMIVWNFQSASPGPQDLHLVVEVADTTLNFDLTTKAGLYAHAGIVEYWVLDVPGRRVIVHRPPQAGRYTTIRSIASGERSAPGSAAGQLPGKHGVRRIGGAARKPGAAFQSGSPRPRRAVLNRRQPGDRFTQNKGFIGAVAEAAFLSLRAGLAKGTGGSFSTPSLRASRNPVPAASLHRRFFNRPAKPPLFAPPQPL
jgi:hypothetical protein